jgi:hypothetical protein
MDQSTGSIFRRLASGANPPAASPISAMSSSAACSSAANVTSVPSSRSSTACPVLATNHAPSASRPSGGVRTSIAHHVMRRALP